MKKKVLSILLAGAMVMSMAACGGDSGDSQSSAAASGSTGSSSSAAAGSSAADAGNATGELVDGKFAETRTITVEVYNRENDGGSDPTNNMYTEYIKQGMLEDHNVQVEFVSVPRWTEVEQINNLLAAGDAPDICVTYDYPTIQTYANMGGFLTWLLTLRIIRPSFLIFGTGWARPTFTGTGILRQAPFGVLRQNWLSATVSIPLYVRTGWMP